VLLNSQQNEYTMSKDHIEKPRNVDYFQVPRPLWKKIRKLFPKPAKQRGRGRPPADNRAVLNGIWYVLWTGCQWKAVHKDWFGVSSSVLHERFQTWQQTGIFAKIMKLMVKFYHKRRTIKWKWQAIDSKSCPAPLGGSETGNNPTDRGKKGQNCICWSINGVRRWRFMSPEPTNMINGLPMI